MLTIAFHIFNASDLIAVRYLLTKNKMSYDLDPLGSYERGTPFALRFQVRADTTKTQTPLCLFFLLVLFLVFNRWYYVFRTCITCNSGGVKHIGSCF